MQEKELKLQSGHLCHAVLYALFVSVFLPYAVTAVVLVVCFVYIVFFKQGLKAFQTRSAWPIVAFTVYGAVVAAVQLNFIGLGCTLLFFMLLTVLFYVRRTAETQMFERCLNLCCLMATAVAFLCYFDCYLNKVILKTAGNYRCTLYFFNCNYLATLLATVILICGYKILTGKKYVILYTLVAVMLAVAVYLTGSMFVWTEVLVGLAMLLFLTRKKQLLGVILLFGATACIILYCAPYLMPRLVDYSGVTTDNRFSIWAVACRDILKNPLFGRGFLGYYHIYGNYAGSYATTHCHNLLLDLLLNFGLVGSAFPVIFIIGYVKRAICCRNAQTKLQQTCLILAVLAAIAIHSTTDLTFLWVQTGLLYCLIFGGIGNEERLLGLKV